MGTCKSPGNIDNLGACLLVQGLDALGVTEGGELSRKAVGPRFFFLILWSLLKLLQQPSF